MPVLAGIEAAPRNITAHAGLRLIAELVGHLGLRSTLDHGLSVKKRKRGFTDADFVLSFVASQLLGGRALDDLTALRDDPELLDLLGLNVPAPTTAGDYLRNVTPGHIRQFEAVQRRVLKRAHRAPIDPSPEVATVEADATYATVYGHQQGADRLYTREVGLHPHFAFRAETGECLNSRMRRGHASAAGGTRALIEFVHGAFAALPGEPKVKRFRGDAAYANVAFLHSLVDEGVEYAVTARMTSRVRDRIATLPESAWRPEPGGRADAGSGNAHRPRRALHAPELAEFVFDLSSSESGVADLETRVVVRRRRHDSKQKALYEDDDGTTYHAVLTNRGDLDAPALLSWTDERGNAENGIRELKNDLDACGCGVHGFHANAFAMHAGVLAYNLICWLRLLAQNTGADDAARWQTRTWRRRMFTLPGYIVRRARQAMLKLSATVPALILMRDLLAGMLDTWG